MPQPQAHTVARASPEAELYDILLRDMGVLARLEAAAVDALWIWDLDDGAGQWMSDRFWRGLGYPTDEAAPGKSWRAICDAEDLQAFDARVAELIAERRVDLHATVRLRHARGFVVPTRVYAVATAEGSAHPRRLLGALTDLSRERQLELLLEETNNAARIGAWSVDLVSEEVFWTPMVYAIHEIDDPEYVPTLGTGIDFYREGYSRTRIREVIERTLADGTPWDEDLEIVTARGNIRWVRAIGHAERHEGKAVRLFGSFQDIHAQKTREIEVAASEALLSTNFDLAPNGMVIMDADGRLERYSRSFAAMLGYEGDELIGRDFRTLMYAEDVPADEAALAQMRAGKIDSFRREKRYLTSAGGTIWADAAVAAIRDDAGEIRKIGVQLVDVTEAKTAEAYRVHLAFLEDKAREMEQFAYIASHDLRQPVLTLRGYLEALREDYGGGLDEQGRHYVATMESAVERMDTMIKGLLDYTRLSKTRDLEEVDLQEVVAQVIGDLEGLRKHTGGRIECGSLPVLRGHRVELGQVFLNLISNALKYHRPGVPPEVTVECERISGGYEFCISDQGVGISESDQDRIFGLFQRVGQRADEDGSGIGLASCKTIVERHGGTIRVDSAPGEGSTFCFTILTDNFG